MEGTPDDRMISWADSVNHLLTWTPTVLAMCLAVEAVWLRLELGHWPRVYRDVAAGGVAILDTATLLLSGLLVLGCPAWLVSLPAASRRGGPRLALTRALLFIGVTILLIVIARVNPYRFPEWWAD